MKYCTKCGNQMTDEMVFCQKCGTENVSTQDAINESSNEKNIANEIHNFGTNIEQIAKKNDTKLRTSMKVWMIISFVFAGIFAIGSTADISMLAGVCLFGILGVMFLALAKAPKGNMKLFTDWNCFKKTQGISKGAFVGVSVFLAIFLFITIINTSTPTTPNDEVANTNTVTETEKNVEQKVVEKKPEIPTEFAEECPVSISVSMYDNIIGFPELSCRIINKTDKEISAIQFYFMPKDVYGEEADGIFAQNKLYCDTPIVAGASYSATWQMLDQSVKSGDLYVYSVYFSDGTEWGDRNAQASKIKKYALKTQASY